MVLDHISVHRERYLAAGLIPDEYPSIELYLNDMRRHDAWGSENTNTLDCQFLNLQRV